ncbi:MAG: Zn-dependent exopeptidase M28 [Chloroflexi bacterium]|nr:MAG: Zn-dependent exopeptidase M28 [Chloroflexota bacterium]
MPHNLPRLLGIGLLLGLILFAPGHNRTEAASVAFDPERALAHIAALAGKIGIRQVGTPNEGRAAVYLATQFVALGLDTRIQPLPVYHLYSQNVIAVKPGQDAEAGTIYIGAHYDSVQWGPGANDNASGTAVLLEAARLLANETFSPTLTFIAFGGEEMGLGGSSYFAGYLPPLEQYVARGMINLDCVGWGTVQAIGFVNESADRLVQKAVDNAAALNIPVTLKKVVNSDHASFSQVKIPAILLYSYAPDEQVCGPYYHQSTDTPETVDVAQMERVAQILLATVRDLADDLPERTLKYLWLPMQRGGQ